MATPICNCSVSNIRATFWLRKFFYGWQSGSFFALKRIRGAEFLLPVDEGALQSKQIEYISYYLIY